MTLPYSDDIKPELSEDEKRAAVRKLMMTIMPIEGVAVLFVYIIPVDVLGWDPMSVALPLVGVVIVSGTYFVLGLRKLERQ